MTDFKQRERTKAWLSASKDTIESANDSSSAVGGNALSPANTSSHTPSPTLPAYPRQPRQSVEVISHSDNDSTLVVRVPDRSSAFKKEKKGSSSQSFSLQRFIGRAMLAVFLVIVILIATNFKTALKTYYLVSGVVSRAIFNTPESGLKAFEEAYAVDPQDTETLQVPLTIYIHQRNLDLADRVVAKALKVPGVDPAALANTYGKAFSANAMNIRAKEQFRKSIALKPNFWKPYNNIGWILFNEKDYKAAAPMGEMMMKLVPENRWGYIMAAASYYNLEDFKKSLAIYQSACDKFPDDKNMAEKRDDTKIQFDEANRKKKSKS